jgi:hypothetical protein
MNPPFTERVKTFTDHRPMDGMELTVVQGDIADETITAATSH